MAKPALDFVVCLDADGSDHMTCSYWPYWRQWGGADAPHVPSCVHDFMRQGRDCGELARVRPVIAQHLAAGFLPGWISG